MRRQNELCNRQYKSLTATCKKGGATNLVQMDCPDGQRKTERDTMIKSLHDTAMPICPAPGQQLRHDRYPPSNDVAE